MRSIYNNGVTARNIATASTLHLRPDENAVRPPDLVARQFTAKRPNQLSVADITCNETDTTARR